MACLDLLATLPFWSRSSVGLQWSDEVKRILVIERETCKYERWSQGQEKCWTHKPVTLWYLKALNPILIVIQNWRPVDAISKTWDFWSMAIEKDRKWRRPEVRSGSRAQKSSLHMVGVQECVLKWMNMCMCALGQDSAQKRASHYFASTPAIFMLT